MVEEEIQGAHLTGGAALEGVETSLAGMSRQEVIDTLLGNRRITQQGGEFSTVIERVDVQTSFEETQEPHV